MSDAIKNPLNDMAALLDADMKAVNDTILARLESPVSIIPQVGRHLIESGGKRIRPLLTLAAASIYGGNMRRAHGLAASVEFIHTATLLHDDVVDDSTERRGKPAAHMVFGRAASVLVGDFLFARAFQLMVDDRSLDVLRILSGAAAVIAQGEVYQLMIAGNPDTTMDQYLEVISAKTAALFAAACEIGPVLGGSDVNAARAMAEYGLNLGIAFQIADDALDYTGDAASMGKNAGDDFAEGKITAPILFAMNAANESANSDERAFWRRVLNPAEQKPGDFENARALIEKHAGVVRAHEMAAEYANRARLALAEAPDHPLRAHLDDLVLFSIRRTS